jgi:oxaloacetate decarboxylase gamma subunit
MAETSLITASLSLMAIGMGIVFSFLLLLVALLRVMSWLSERLAPSPGEVAPAAAAPVPAVDSSSDELVAVIGAAITRYRSRVGR